jgi:hypothetical protein
MLSDFMQVLNSVREFYIKNQYFSSHRLFSTISLLQKQRLNPKNYSKRYLIMEFFYKLLIMVCTCMKEFRALQSVDICKQIFLYLSSYNFVQETTAQMRFWLSPL